MTANVATLGLTVDSSQVKSATAALQGLTAAAAPAATATNNLTNALKPAAAAHAGLSTQAMSAGHAVRSAIESIIAGSSPTQALALQLNHLSYAAQGPQGLSGAFKEAGAAIGGLITPTTLIVGAIAGVTIGLGLAIHKVAETEIAFAALSSRAGTTVTSLHALESAAAFKGISTADFTKDMEKFSDLTYEARSNMGSLAETFRANNVAVGTLEQNFAHASDLIKNAKDDAARYAIIQQLGLPPTRQWVELLKQGSDGIAAAKAAAVEFGGQPTDQLVQAAKRADEAWNRVWNGIVTGTKTAIVGIADFLSRIPEAVIANEEAGAGFGGPNRSVENPPLPTRRPLQVTVTADKNTVDPNAEKNNLALANLHISTLGNLATVEDLVKQKQNELTLANLAGANVSKSQIAAIVEYTRNLNLGVIAIRQQVAQQEIATQTLGMNVGEAAAYAAVQERINEARIAGRPLDAAKIAELKQEAEALAQVVQLNSNLTELKSTANDALSGFVKDLAAGKSGLEALNSALQKVENKLIDMVTQQLVTKALGGLVSGLGGGLIPAGALSGGLTAPSSHTGGIVGSESGPTRTLPASVFASAPRFHGGGLAGDEVPTILRKGEGVFTRNQMANLAPAGGGGGNHVQVNVINNAENTSVSTSKRSQGGTDIHDIIIQTVGKAMSNGALDGPLRARTGQQVQPRGR